MAERKSNLAKVALDERSVVRRSPEVEHERAVALYDLTEENDFRPNVEHPGPYALYLRIEESRLVLDIRDEAEQPLSAVHLSMTPFRRMMTPFRRIVKDYFEVCESYFAAIKAASPSRIEAIDMGRRGLHNEGSELLRERLTGKVEMDLDTARRLFTLICVLHIRG
jgi:uncharacterized protein (UPF0262 family)